MAFILARYLKYPWLKLADRKRALFSHIETTRICEQLHISFRFIDSVKAQRLQAKR